MGIWNDFLGPLIYLHTPEKQTIQVLIASMQAMYIGQSDYPMIMAAAIIAMVPVIIVFFSANDTLSSRWQSAESRGETHAKYAAPVEDRLLSWHVRISGRIGIVGMRFKNETGGGRFGHLQRKMYANPFPS